VHFFNEIFQTVQKVVFTFMSETKLCYKHFWNGSRLHRKWGWLSFPGQHAGLGVETPAGILTMLLSILLFLNRISVQVSRITTGRHLQSSQPFDFSGLCEPDFNCRWITDAYSRDSAVQRGQGGLYSPEKVIFLRDFLQDIDLITVLPYFAVMLLTPPILMASSEPNAEHHDRTAILTSCLMALLLTLMGLWSYIYPVYT